VHSRGALKRWSQADTVSAEGIFPHLLRPANPSSVPPYSTDRGPPRNYFHLGMRNSPAACFIRRQLGDRQPRESDVASRFFPPHAKRACILPPLLPSLSLSLSLSGSIAWNVTRPNRVRLRVNRQIIAGCRNARSNSLLNSPSPWRTKGQKHGEKRSEAGDWYGGAARKEIESCR